MRYLTTHVAPWLLLLGLLQSFSACARATTGPRRSTDEQRDAAATKVKARLPPLLSDDATITFPWSSRWDDLTVRASTPRISPEYVAIVEVATESDVQNVIKVANHLKLPFLVVSGTHGWPSTMNNVKLGIQINMRKLNSTSISSDGLSATAGGGIMQYEITSALYEQGKQSVIGICECVSTIGPLLGGGHSMLQATKGFAADNLLSARVVLADGSVVTASDDENKDLFWAMRGAGHNFGVVTSFELKLYDVPEERWTMIALSFTQDKLEGFFKTWNRLEVEYEDPGLLLLNGVMNRNPELDANNPLINLQLLYHGDDTAVDVYATAFRKLSPVVDSTTSNIAWGDLFDVGGFGLESPVCRKNENIYGFPNSFTKWNPSAMRKGFTLFAEVTADEKFSTSAWLLESYGRKGVQAVPESSNAVAPEERRYHILTSPILWWQGNDAADAEKAAEYGKKIQSVVRRGTTDTAPHSYLNYAYGKEELGEVYGRDLERLKKLKTLKKKWDPKNRFGFYSPIS